MTKGRGAKKARIKKIERISFANIGSGEKRTEVFTF